MVYRTIIWKECGWRCENGKSVRPEKRRVDEARFLRKRQKYFIRFLFASFLDFLRACAWKVGYFASCAAVGNWRELPLADR